MTSRWLIAALLVLPWFLPWFASSEPDNCEKKIRLVVDNTSPPPEPRLERYFTPKQTHQMFNLLSLGKCTLMPLIMTRTLQVPEWLAPHSFSQEVTVQMFLENKTLARTPIENVLTPLVQARLVLGTPSIEGDRFFIERLIPRTDLYRILRDSGIPTSTLAQKNRLSRWSLPGTHTVTFAAVRIDFDLSELSENAFDMLLNKAAAYLDKRTPASLP